MVSVRCKMIVKDEMEKQGLVVSSVELGVVETPNEVSESQMASLRDNLFKSGLIVLDDKKSILIEKIKAVIIEMIHLYLPL
jgi:hypothetical protein